MAQLTKAKKQTGFMRFVKKAVKRKKMKKVELKTDSNYYLETEENQRNEQLEERLLSGNLLKSAIPRNVCSHPNCLDQCCMQNKKDPMLSVKDESKGSHTSHSQDYYLQDSGIYSNPHKQIDPPPEKEVDKLGSYSGTSILVSLLVKVSTKFMRAIIFFFTFIFWFLKPMKQPKPTSSGINKSHTCSTKQSQPSTRRYTESSASNRSVNRSQTPVQDCKKLLLILICPLFLLFIIGSLRTPPKASLQPPKNVQKLTPSNKRKSSWLFRCLGR